MWTSTAEFIAAYGALGVRAAVRHHLRGRPARGDAFLPGDSLLFVVGAMCGAGLMNLPLAMALLLVAAVLNCTVVNYSIGRHFGPKSLPVGELALLQQSGPLHAGVRTDFYERHGGVTIIIPARFMPFIRTINLRGGRGRMMTRAKFVMFNVTGAMFQVIGLTLAGYLFGNLPCRLI